MPCHNPIHMHPVDLVIVGDSPAARSLAVEAREAGLTEVVLRPGPARIETDGTGVVAAFDDEKLEARAAAEFVPPSPIEIPLSVPPSLSGRVHAGGLPEDTWDVDVLVVGGSEAAVEMAIELAQAGTGTVLALGGAHTENLSRLSRGNLLRREAERRLTILWHSRPAAVEDLGGEPMVTFNDTGTPDLLFDHIVFMGDPVGADTSPGGPVYLVGDGGLAAGRAWEAIRKGSFPRLAPTPRPPHRHDAAEAEELRQAHYNATITHFDRAHSDLWLLRVKPDHGDVAHEAGQYASLGLGYWEPRADAARDPGLDRKWERLVRRSYSISSPIFDEHGYLSDPARADTLEFYIVLVPASSDRVPALTPRLALRQPGDRIYVGPRIVGRYTLAPVVDPGATVVFLATGTGEAPHNAMIAELFRKGHSGPIVSVVSVRYRPDLAYLATHRRLEKRFGNYHYLPLVTRDPDQEKLYVQDVIERDLLAREFGVLVDPATTHVYLCGNPAMIGLPRWEEDRPVFPETVGVCQLLAERGFDLDRSGHTGNVHSEKYW
ncbi:MAG: hypothetical protein WB239_10425 [Acidimicrobiia bacterium]